MLGAAAYLGGNQARHSPMAHFLRADYTRHFLVGFTVSAALMAMRFAGVA